MRRVIEINDLIDLLQIDQRVKSYTRKCIDANPRLVARATVEYMDREELEKLINSGNSNPKAQQMKNSIHRIMVFDQLEPICKNTEGFGKQLPQTDTLSAIFPGSK